MAPKLVKPFQYLQALANRGGPEESDDAELTQVFSFVANQLRNGDITVEQLKEEWRSIGDAFTSTQTCQGLACIKPYGYAGDFEMIERIYQCWMSSTASLRNWDRYFHAQGAPKAVRNRKQYFLRIVEQLSANHNNSPFAILNLGSGPCSDLVEHFARHPASSAKFDCVDQDQHAIAYAHNITYGLSTHVQLHHSGLLNYASPTRYNLIWSAGVFDYFDNRLFRIALKRYLRLVKSGGEMIIGNFSPANPTRDYMEFGLWMLHHRDANQLVELVRSCDVPEECIQVESEPLEVNLFLRIRYE